MGLRRNKKYKLDLETADATLQNVLAACDKSLDTTPSGKRILWQKLNIHLHNRQLILTAAVLIPILLLLIGIIPMAKLWGSQAAPEPVALVNDYVENGFLYLELSGDNILYGEAWMTASDGGQIPGAYDKSTGLVSFPFPESGEYNIFIPVKNGDPFQLLLSLK